jgi:two-component system chemotaxis response regulator CheB
MRRPVRVLVVDDSAFVRQILAKNLEAHPGITVVGKARDGLEALDQIKAHHPDVVTLDVEMPRMDGLTAMRRIMAECPTRVIMLSAFTQQGARATIQALMRGAVDFVCKPDAPTDAQSVIRELITKIRVVAITPAGSRLPAHPTRPFPQASKLEPRTLRRGDPVIVIGASTGGPQALQQVLSDLPADLPAAVVVVQHMPPNFTRALAQRLDENSPITVREAAAGDRLARGLVLVAPGDYHLQINGRGQVNLDSGPRRNGVRPAVDVSMESAAEHHGAVVIGVVLTGMGIDGTSGARHVKTAGGRVIAQDQETSIIYGMPRSVVEEGLADVVVSLPELASTLMTLIR